MWKSLILIAVVGCSGPEYRSTPQVDPVRIAVVPPIESIRKRSAESEREHLLKAKEDFYRRCNEKIRLASGEGRFKAGVFFDHGTEKDHQETIQGLIAAGYTVEVVLEGVLISWAP